jgi:hypothetical protein
MIYNKTETIRTDCSVERIYSTNKGFIGRLESVEYKQNDGSWKEQGSRWLINEDDPIIIMDYGFKSAKM